jgi:hypothetical protein
MAEVETVTRNSATPEKLVVLFLNMSSGMTGLGQRISIIKNNRTPNNPMISIIFPETHSKVDIPYINTEGENI